MINLIRQQVINLIIYLSTSLGFSFFRHGFPSNSYILPIIILCFSYFICSSLIIYNGVKFKGSQLFIFLIPQLLGLSILVLIALDNKYNGYIIGYGIDEILWGFLVISTLLNIRAYFASKIKIINTL